MIGETSSALGTYEWILQREMEAIVSPPAKESLCNHTLSIPVWFASPPPTNIVSPKLFMLTH